MNIERETPQSNRDTWSAKHPAVLSQNLGPGARSVLVRHPAYPFWATTGQAEGLLPMQQLANAYLAQVQALAGLSDALLKAVVSGLPSYFGWLPVSWGLGELNANAVHARGSYWVARKAKGKVVDRTLVLLAGYRLSDGRGWGGEVGLRVPIHVGPGPKAGEWMLRITGMSTANLPLGLDKARLIDIQTSGLADRLTALVHSLNYGPLTIDGMAFVDPTQDETLRAFLSCSRPSADGGAPRSFRLVIDLPDGGGPESVLQQQERITHADTPVFTRDPASYPPPSEPIEKRRPTRRAERLEALRVPDPDIPATLQNADASIQVRQTRLGQIGSNPDLVQVITPGWLPLRSDAQAAAHAYLRGDELMQRLRAYGFVLKDYFSAAELPLRLRHRAPLKGARDGVSINAQVRPGDVGAGLLTTSGNTTPPPLEVSFGWAELAHRSRQPVSATRSREQPLGLAADPRWAWHEFGHVLIFACLGELEFRFAHSVGDALAAIVADPDSIRASEGAARFMTFPWVFLPRRHDRDPSRGWCWCGRRNLPRLAQADAPSDAPPGPRLGYFEEQLLSTSLFRLYRCIGGDSSDLSIRRSASDYCVYLAMRAIRKLGNDGLAPAYTIDNFVAALTDADIATGDWSITATWPRAEAARYVHRIGGCVRKVIDWAFEQQGLRAAALASEIVEGLPGPPKVDLYIADGRARTGSYDPVPLDPGAGTPPLWHATAAGIRLVSGNVVIQVGNLGTLDASDVRVSCWALSTSAIADPNDPEAWSVLDPAPGPLPDSVVSKASTDFSFLPKVGGVALAGEYYVKASATCPSDLSNLDPDTKSSLDTTVTPLVDLIANDNNLGLRILTFV